MMVALLTALFVFLGLWQLDRHEERQAANVVGEERYESGPIQLSVLTSTFEIAELENRRAYVDGAYDADNEVLIRSQVYRGQAGFHVITPLVREDGTAVLVNRGWVPLVMNEVPVSEAMPALSSDRVEGWVHLTEVRGALGPIDANDGRLVHMSRVDIDRIQAQVPYQLDPVYLVRIGKNGKLPEPLAEPVFDDEGAHFSYAFQWFSFALVLVIGFVLLMRRRLSRGLHSME